MKSWVIKTVVGADHRVEVTVPDDVPTGSVEMVIVVQPLTAAATTVGGLGWTREQADETRARLKSFEEDWNAPGMEAYDAL